MQRCPTCEAEFADELEGCPNCTAVLVAPGSEGEVEVEGEVHRCAHCAEDYRDSDACPACGTLRESAPCETHPERDAVGRCVICGRAVCEECQATHGGAAVLCEEHRTVTVIEGWAQVYSEASEFQAQLLRENLRAEGIDAQIYSQRDRAFPMDLGELSIVRLLVPVWEYERAMQLIREHTDREGEVVFACPNCGEVNDPGARECASCGVALV